MDLFVTMNLLAFVIVLSTVNWVTFAFQSSHHRTLRYLGNCRRAPPLILDSFAFSEVVDVRGDKKLDEKENGEKNCMNEFQQIPGLQSSIVGGVLVCHVVARSDG